MKENLHLSDEEFARRFTILKHYERAKKKGDTTPYNRSMFKKERFE